jgi:hypothetical protein
MSFKEQLEAEKQIASDNDVIIENVKNKLLQAAKNGESTIFIELIDENDLKSQLIFHFLQSEGVKFDKKYDVKEVEEKSYYDPHMANYHEYVAKNNGSSIYTYKTKKFTFKGISISL